MEGRRQRRQRPQVRARRVLERAGVGLRVVERHPAGERDRRIEEVHERGVLVVGDRLGVGRLPPDRVLGEPRARPAGEPAGGAADVGRQRQPGHREVGLPGVGHVARDVGQAHALAPVPFVGIDAGVELAGEQLGKAVAQDRDLARARAGPRRRRSRRGESGAVSASPRRSLRGRSKAGTASSIWQSPEAAILSSA